MQIFPDLSPSRLRTTGMKCLLVGIVAFVLTTSVGAAPGGGITVALVTAERQNQLLAVDLASGKVLRRVSLPADPENVIGGKGTTTVVVSPTAGAVTLLDWRSLRTIRVFRGFTSPHIAAFHPSGEWAFVTDDSTGELSTIELAGPRMVSRIFVGKGAHHEAASPDGRRLWIALGEEATRIAIVAVSRPGKPRLLRRFNPGFVVHDLAFAPDGRRVWVTSADGEDVHVLNARTGREVFAVRVGAPPQHVVFSRARDVAYATSGYGRRLLAIDPARGHVLARAKTPYGSFNVSALGGVVSTTSLLNGTVSEFDGHLRRMRAVKAATAARSVALTVW
jgi:DNA-binding beta-propeller fold protein YncE